MANLLEKASIILTPTAYDDGKVLAIKPSEAPYGDFDFTRNSSATRVNAQGLVEDVQILSSNLVQNGDFSQIGSEEVTNGNFSQESSELILNGDFATDSDWQLTQATISNGKATFVTTDGSFSGIRQNVFTIGKTYLISLEVSNLIGTAQVNTNGGTSIGLDITSNGIKSFYMVAENTDIEIKRKFGITNVSASIDNVSVKEVGQDWTLGTGWSIGEDKAIAVSGASTRLEQSISGLSGKTCKVSFTLSDYGGSGSVYVDFGSVNSDLINTNGIHIVYGTFDQDEFELFKGAAFIGSITNISVKEVGQNWSLGTGWSIGDSEAISDGGSTNLDQTGTFLSGKTYKVAYTIEDYVSGDTRFRFTGTSNENGTLRSANGTYTEYITLTNNQSTLRFVGSGVLSVTNISVIEITDDTNLPRINYSGFTYQDSLGSELVVNGDFSSQDISMITGAGIRSIVNGELKIEESTLSYSQVIYSNILDTNKIYKATFDITFGTGSYIIYNTTNGNISLTSQGSGTYTFYLQNTNKFYVGSNGVGDVWYMDNISVKEYSGQEVVPDSGCGAWLFEPQSTNLITYSEDFSQWFSSGDVTVESGYLAPDGTNNAYKISGTTSALTLGGASETSTRTIYARTISGTGQANLCSFNQNTNNLFTITDQWQRFEVNGAIATGGTTFYAVDFRGNTTLTEILLWGAQSEALSYATSYIPTEGTIKTRNQDLCTNGGDVSLINSSEGVLYAQISALDNDLTR